MLEGDLRADLHKGATNGDGQTDRAPRDPLRRRRRHRGFRSIDHREFSGDDPLASRNHRTLDTAGRLHTSEGLMDELKKVARVIAKRLPGSPHETLLVLDGTSEHLRKYNPQLFYRLCYRPFGSAPPALKSPVMSDDDAGRIN